jgi:hypothetical protein
VHWYVTLFYVLELLRYFSEEEIVFLIGRVFGIVWLPKTRRGGIFVQSWVYQIVPVKHRTPLECVVEPSGMFFEVDLASVMHTSPRLQQVIGRHG